MPTNTWHGTAAARAQVTRVTPNTPSVGWTYKLRVKDELNNYTELLYVATDTNPATVAAALVALVNACAHPFVAGKMTAAAGSGYLDLTSSVAGRPMILADASTGGPTLTIADQTTNAGPADVKCADNWTLGVPVNAQDLVIASGSGPMLYNLDLSAVAAGSVRRMAGTFGDVGRTEAGILYHLRVGATSLKIEGAGSLVAIDVGSSAIAPIVDHVGTPPSTREHAVYLKGSALTELHVKAGKVAIGDPPGETATVTSKFNVTGGRLVVAAGTTVTGTTANVKTGGELRAHASIPTVNANGGRFAQEAGAATAYTADGKAVLELNCAGTFAVTAYDDTVIDCSRTAAAKTITGTLRGRTVVIDPGHTATLPTPQTTGETNANPAARAPTYS